MIINLLYLLFPAIISIYLIKKLLEILVSIKQGSKELPGPWGIPILGYLPFLGEKLWENLEVAGRKFNGIFQINCCARTVVVLDSLDIIKDAHTKDISFAGRPDTPSMEVFRRIGSKFLFHTGDGHWRFMRKTAVRALSLFSTSRNSRLESVTAKACQSFHEDIEKHLNQAYNPRQSAFECVAGIIGSVNYGLDFDRNDPLMKNVIQLTNKVAEFVQLGSVMDFLPFGDYIMAKRIDDFVQANMPINIMTERHIANHQVMPEGKIGDVSDALFNAAEEIPKETKDQFGVTDLDIRLISQDLFAAGFITTMESFIWCLNLMAEFPEHQNKVRQELREKIGNREPNLNDRAELFYCEAFINEMFRTAALAALGLPHSLMNDTQFRGYTLKKGTIVMTNLYGHHRNPKYFPDPKAFKPERYLNADGTLNNDVIQTVIPFSVGKRRCIGENMARQELFLLISRTVQKFEIMPAPGVVIDHNQSSAGLTRGPLEYELMFRKCLE